MENQNELTSRNVWVVFCLLLLFIGVAVAVFLTAVSEPTKLLLLGSGLVAGGIWGRRKLGQQ